MTDLDNEKLIDIINTFKSDRVWVTKKIRMGSEAVRKKINMHLQILLNYYSVSTLALSVITYKNSDELLDTWNLIISIFLLGITITVTNLNLEHKANEFKKSYILLDQLEAKIDRLVFEMEYSSDKMSFELANEKFFDLKEEYSKILNETDNHSNFDLITYKKIRQPKTLSHYEYYMHGLTVLIYFVILIITFVLPIYILVNKLIYGGF